MQINFPDVPVDYNSVRKPEPEKPEKPEKRQPPPPYAVESKIGKSDDLVKLQTVLAEKNISLDYSRDEQTGQMIVRMLDSQTGESIRQFPSDVSLKLSALYIKLQGQFINNQG